MVPEALSGLVLVRALALASGSSDVGAPQSDVLSQSGDSLVSRGRIEPSWRRVSKQSWDVFKPKKRRVRPKSGRVALRRVGRRRSAEAISGAYPDVSSHYIVEAIATE